MRVRERERGTKKKKKKEISNLGIMNIHKNLNLQVESLLMGLPNKSLMRNGKQKSFALPLRFLFIIY